MLKSHDNHNGFKFYFLYVFNRYLFNIANILIWISKRIFITPTVTPKINEQNVYVHLSCIFSWKKLKPWKSFLIGQKTNPDIFCWNVWQANQKRLPQFIDFSNYLGLNLLPWALAHDILLRRYKIFLLLRNRVKKVSLK